MEQIWKEMFQAARAVQNGRQISGYVDAGGVAAAILSSGKIYVGVCVDACSTLGICAERNAIYNMITNGEQKKCLQSCQMENPAPHVVPVGN